MVLPNDIMLGSGALSHDSEQVVRITAKKVLAMYENGGPGVLGHVQTQRFLNPDFQGLGPGDVPFRPFVERLAKGERLADMEDEDAAPFKRWVSAFRLVT